MSITPAQSLDITTAVVKRCRISPFLVGARCFLSVPAAAASTVYRVEHPGDGDVTKYAKFTMPGGVTTRTMPAAMNDLDTANVSDANRLRLIVLVNGSPIVRVNSAPSAGQFYASSTTVLTLGSTYAIGTKLEVIAMDAADITNTGSLAAGTITEETCQSFYTASAPVTLMSAERG